MLPAPQEGLYWTPSWRLKSSSGRQVGLTTPELAGTAAVTHTAPRGRRESESHGGKRFGLSSLIASPALCLQEEEMGSSRCNSVHVYMPLSRTGCVRVWRTDPVSGALEFP